MQPEPAAPKSFLRSGIALALALALIAALIILFLLIVGFY
jgi:hypothetical protein